MSITHGLAGPYKAQSYTVRLGPAALLLAENFRALSIWMSTGRHSQAFNRAKPERAATNTIPLHNAGLLRPTPRTLKWRACR